MIASSRYRVYQFIPYLESQGISCTALPAVPEWVFNKLSYKNGVVKNIFYNTSEFLGRLKHLAISGKFDLVLVQKKLTTMNIRGLDRILRALAKKVILDIDDAVFLPSEYYFSRKIFTFFQDKNQVSKIARFSCAVIAGNSYLKQLATGYNPNVYIIPTCVDTDRFIPAKDKNHPRVTVGWVGSFATLEYLLVAKDALRKIADKFDISIKLIGLPGFKIEGINLEAISWNYESEVKELQSLDIGIMPMPDNPWTRGKCALKALQYMAVGIPVVSSPVGMIKEILKNGVNGFLASDEQDWLTSLSLLIQNPDLRQKMGIVNRNLVKDNYSLRLLAPNLCNLLKNIALESKNERMDIER
jgi:glycosyltransferase involved in cell wall biosynthesis